MRAATRAAIRIDGDRDPEDRRARSAGGVPERRAGAAAPTPGRGGAGVVEGGGRRGAPVGGRVRVGHTREVSDDVATDAGRDRRAELRQAPPRPGRAPRAIPPLARRGLGDPDPGVQAAALGALDRLGELTADDVVAALDTGAAPLRRRAVEAAPGRATAGARARCSPPP